MPLVTAILQSIDQQGAYCTENTRGMPQGLFDARNATAQRTAQYVARLSLHALIHVQAGLHHTNMVFE
jgi:hypothetical protein